MDIKNYYIKSDGVLLYAEVCGKGEPLILLHGNGEDHHYFENQIPEFAKYYKVIAIDTRAHGKSAGSGQPMDFNLFARDVIAVMNELQIDQAHVLGFSDGGNTALHIALNYPERLLSLILNGANLSPKGEKLYIRLIDILYYALCTLLSPLHPKFKKRREYLSLMVKHPHIFPKQLQTIETPALVVAGENDLIKTKHTELIAHSIPDSRLVIIPNADHFAAKKKPEIFNQIILKFLKNSSDS